MKFNELDRLKQYINEDDLIEIVEEIGDKIIFRGYNFNQIICLVNELLEIDLFSLKYESREAILSVLCDAVSYYNVRNKVNWGNILENKERLENDLKAYIQEFILEN